MIVLYSKTSNEKEEKLKKEYLQVFYLLVFFTYFFFAIISNYFQHYEYVFSDVNNKKKYEIFSDIRTFYGYIDLENDMYEDKNNFIGCDFEYNYETDKKEERYYIVIDKNKASMKIFSEKEFKEKYNISDGKFINIYTFLKKKGTKIGRYR
ncbi:hypothetical protein [Fusobacterium sp. CAG:649]|uniref:hypothetical protein n=1 Tax=Fusobacterium sp. CAG:649 TaxID=1262900 RepID=UPI00033BE682|nr:hypothetical protein [Fusobacterium sp. CAG:649]CDA08840.1 putative uncharacterized protein [Fusobacterium sp. CAG:649]